MDAQRFDNMAKSLAGKWSRRKALRQMGVAAGAGMLAAAGVREEQIRALAQAQSDGKPLYTMIRRYELDEPTAKVRKALQAGYTDAACKAPGFVAYLTVEDEDGDFATVAVFASQDALEAFAKAEAAWIAQNLGNLLPAPAETTSGDTYIHAVAQKGFTNTCPARAPQGAATVTPADNGSNSGALPTAVPGNPTPTPTPLPSPTPELNCRDAGCVCTTGTQRACKGDLVCCPTTDLMGGPGICRTQAECYPNQCPANGETCPDTCAAGADCAACCSGYCAADGTCGDAPAPCTGAGCDCSGGVQGACDDGLVCCQSGQSIPGGAGTCQTQAECDAQPCTGAGCGCATGTEAPCDSGLVCCPTTTRPGGPGVCQTEAQCVPVTCTGEGCDCNGGVQGACDDGLVCCQDDPSVPGGAGTCQPEAQCAPPPCTGAGCACNGGVQGACDDGLVCCQEGESIPGGPGTCQTEAQCNPPCTGEGCACNGGVQGACNDGLVCCQDESVPGGPGTCTTEANCAPPACTGEGCSCNGGVQGNCDTGLVCCQSGQSIPGGPGVCVVEGSCVSQTCVATGTGCDATCNWGDACDSCCTGYCNSTGVCGDEPPAPVCVADGELCTDDCAWSSGCNSCCSGFCNGSGVCSEPGASAGACGDEGCQCAVNNPCNEGLICCDDGSGERGVCQTAC